MGDVASGGHCFDSCKEQGHKDSAQTTTVKNNSYKKEI